MRKGVVKRTVKAARPRRQSVAARRSPLSAQERLVLEMVGVCLAAARAFGVDVSKVMTALHSVRSAHGRVVLARKLFRDVELLSRLAQDWMEQGPYLDPSGRPKLLPVTGEGASFATLARKHFRGRKLNEVLEIAVRLRMLERVGENQVAQVSPIVMMTGDPVLMLARAVLSVRWLLGVAERNGPGSRGRAGRVPERMACMVVPKKYAAAFVDLMRPQLSNVAEMANRLLATYGVRDQDRSTGSELVGVHAYVFRDDSSDR